MFSFTVHRCIRPPRLQELEWIGAILTSGELGILNPSALPVDVEVSDYREATATFDFNTLSIITTSNLVISYRCRAQASEDAPFARLCFEKGFKLSQLSSIVESIVSVTRVRKFSDPLFFMVVVNLACLAQGLCICRRGNEAMLCIAGLAHLAETAVELTTVSRIDEVAAGAA